MPALQSIALDDRTPVTPVTHSFIPRDIKAGVGLVVANAGVPVGEERLTISMRKSGARFKGDLRIALPVVVTETINGVDVPRVVHTDYVEASVNFDERSTPQQRNNAVGMLADALGIDKVLVHQAFVGLEGVYGA